VECQYTQEYIANVLWNQDIAKVSSITLIPYLTNDKIYSIAYVNIDQWCETEVAYNFINRLKDASKEVRIVHRDEDWWLVQLNTHNNGDIYVGDYTLSFMTNYFVRNIPVENEYKDEECKELICNKCINNDYYYYSADKAMSHLWVINKDGTTFIRQDVRKQFNNFDTELTNIMLYR